MDIFGFFVLLFIGMLIYDTTKGGDRRRKKGGINDDHTDASVEHLTGYKF